MDERVLLVLRRVAEGIDDGEWPAECKFCYSYLKWNHEKQLYEGHDDDCETVLARQVLAEYTRDK